MGRLHTPIFPSAPSSGLVLPRLGVLSASRIPAGAVAGVVRCCPALQELTLSEEVPGCAHLAALRQLSTLTHLELCLKPEQDGASTAVTIQSLAGLTTLQQLYVPLSTGGIKRQDLLPLTALRQLTRLITCNISTLTTQAGPGQPPDVWLQLLEDCAEDTACLPSIIRSYARQQQNVTDLQQDMTDLKQHLAEQQRLIAGQQQQLVEQQHHIAQLQQQMIELQQQLAGRLQDQAEQQQGQ